MDLTNKSSYELRDIIANTSDADLRNAAGAQLKEQVGFTGTVDELALMKEIASAVIDRPGSLDMGSWHCGTSHCIAGWACVLNKDAAALENVYTTELAGAVVLPSYSHLFFKNNEEAMAALKEIAAQ